MKKYEPAFPSPSKIQLCIETENHGNIESQGGLTKRDYFASKAMQALLANSAVVSMGKEGLVLSKGKPDELPKIISENSFLLADAFLTQSEKTI